LQLTLCAIIAIDKYRLKATMVGKEDILIEQYRQCFEHLRQVQRWIWQIPTIIISIGSGAVAAAFGYLSGNKLGQSLLLGTAAILLFTMAFVLLRYRYFAGIWIGTIARIEDELDIKHVQLTGDADSEHGNLYKKVGTKGLLYPSTPRTKMEGLGGLSAEILLFWSMIGMGCVLAQISWWLFLSWSLSPIIGS